MLVFLILMSILVTVIVCARVHTLPDQSDTFICNAVVAHALGQRSVNCLGYLSELALLFGNWILKS